MLFETECLGKVTSFSSRMFTTIGHDTLVQQQESKRKRPRRRIGHLFSRAGIFLFENQELKLVSKSVTLSNSSPFWIFSEKQTKSRP